MQEIIWPVYSCEVEWGCDDAAERLWCRGEMCPESAVAKKKKQCSSPQ